MSDEPRRSGRATKGQHKNASSSPAPPTKPPPVKPATVKGKPAKKSLEPEPNDDDDDDDEVIRCICSNTNPKDKRAFIGCDACTVWQHNVCMGLPDDEDEVPDHYFCEECRPEEHQETIQAKERGEKIWETRNRIFQNEKKMSKSRKSKNKLGEEYRPGWLKKDVVPEEKLENVTEAPAHEEAKDDAVPERNTPSSAQPTTPASAPAPAPVAPASANVGHETGNKRKRDAKEEEQEETKPVPEEKPTRPTKQEKRRKSSIAQGKTAKDADVDTDMALVEIDQLPPERQKPAHALAGIIATGVQDCVKFGFRLPDGKTPASLGEEHATRIEYAMHINHTVGTTGYSSQFRALHANLKKNHALIQRLLDGSLTADEISTMTSGDMASEELQRARAEMKEVLDRQATVDQPESPKYAQDHKGYHLIETETQRSKDSATQPQPQPQPQSQATTGAAQAISTPIAQPTAAVNVDRRGPSEGERRQSNQQFDMSNIWAKTAQSPTNSTPPVIQRPTQTPARRHSSVRSVQAQQNGAKEDADIDRMLEDNDDTYVPSEATGEDAIVWRGKLVQSSEDGAPTVNARFVAGRDLASSIPWKSLLPQILSIDGRLQTQKAEDYLCGLRWSSTSDVAVLSLTPHDNAEAFNSVFDYFHSRQRYAVIEKDKPPMVKDLYIIPVEAGTPLPGHVGMLEHCTLKKPVEERLLLATIIVTRAPDSPIKPNMPAAQQSAGPNTHLPPHVRTSIGGPTGSPMSTQHQPILLPDSGGPPPPGHSAPNTFPLISYGPHAAPPPLYPPLQPHRDPQVNLILGELQYAPTAQTIFREAPSLNVDQLKSLKVILTEDVNAQTDIGALAKRLYAGK